MPWWGWIIVGALLLGAEIVAVDAEFYLVFVGISALAVGLLGLVGLELPVWGQWLIFAGLCLLSFYFFRGRLYKRIRGNLPGFEDNPSGSVIRLEADLLPGETCRQEFRGTTWTLRNTSDTAIGKGSDARVSGVDGLTLNVGAD